MLSVIKSYCLSISLLIYLVLQFSNCKTEKTQSSDNVSLPVLKSIFSEDFHIGAALGKDHITGVDEAGQQLVLREYNTITPENMMKWMHIHPARDSFYFEIADQFVKIGQENDMNIVGHALVWHSQLAEFVDEVQDSLELLGIIQSHIASIVGRYKDQIDSWDVVNEALNEDGSYRESIFLKVIGPSYLELAFKAAEKADPNATLIYNDYNLWKPEKRAGVIRMVKELRSKGAKIDAIGLQGHYSLAGPESNEVEASIKAFAENELDVMFTELDITALPNPWDLEGAEVSQNYEGSPFMNPYPDFLPDSVSVHMAERYEELFALFLKHSDKISRVTFWGVNNQHSWLNNWPINGRTNYPLLFDRQYNSTLAHKRIMDLKIEGY